MLTARAIFSNQFNDFFIFDELNLALAEVLVLSWSLWLTLLDFGNLFALLSILVWLLKSRETPVFHALACTTHDS
jgi:hypothetical protein